MSPSSLVGYLPPRTLLSDKTHRKVVKQMFDWYDKVLSEAPATVADPPLIRFVPARSPSPPSRGLGGCEDGVGAVGGYDGDADGDG